MKFELKIAINSLTFLLFVNFLIYLLFFLFQFFIGERNLGVFLTLFGGLEPAKVLKGEVYSMITSTFLHFDFLHFFVNVFSLYRLGEIVMYFYQGRVLFVSYIVAGIAGSALTVLMSFLTGSFVPSVGASGAIFGLLGLILAGSISKNRGGPTLPFNFFDILPLIIFSLVYGFIPGTNINNWAHIGGLLSGFALGFFFTSTIGYARKEREEIFLNVLYQVCKIFFVLSFLWLIINFLNLLIL